MKLDLNAARTMYALLAFAGCLLFSGLFLSYWNHDLFINHLVAEDGPTEWLTVLVFLFSAILCFVRWRRSRDVRPRTYRAVLLMLFLLFVFGMGEEVSWGQRILSVESNTFFSQYNAQGETNLHNLRIGGVGINKLVFGTGFALILTTYLLVVTPLYYRKQTFRDWLDQFAVPIPRPIQIMGFVILLVVVELMMSSSRRGEMTEVVGAILVFATLLSPHNHENFNP